MDVLTEKHQIEGYIFGNFDENGDLDDDDWGRELNALLHGIEINPQPEYNPDKPLPTNLSQHQHVDDFSEFDVFPAAASLLQPPLVKPLPDHLKRFQGPFASINFTEFHLPSQKSQKSALLFPPSPTLPILPVDNHDDSQDAVPGDATEEINDDNDEALSSNSPKRIRVAQNQHELWLQIKVKYTDIKPDRMRIPLGPVFPEQVPLNVSPSVSLPSMSQQYPIDASTLVELQNWEESIIWDDDRTEDEAMSPTMQKPIAPPQTRYIDQELLHANWNWDDASIIWDDTHPNTYIPTPRLYIDPQLFGVSFVPIVKKRQLTSQQPPSLNLEEDCVESMIPIRRRLFIPSSFVQHSPFSLQHKLVPWQMTDAMCRQFHRPVYSVQSGKSKLTFVQPPEIRPEEQIQAHNARQWSLGDLSAMDNIVILVEYTEQHPPIIQNVGMASKLRSFYSQESDDDIALNLCENAIGENVSLAPDDPSPFLGKIKPGERMYGIENKLYKAAMFESSCVAGSEWTDLLLSKTPSGWLVRRVSKLFVVGQTLPLQKVPSPSSKTSMNYSRDRLKHFITESLRRDPKILLQDVKNIFPSETDASIRNVLSDYCKFKRKGSQAWLMNPDAQLQAESVLWALATPEAVCLNESSHAALLRLKDMGIIRFTNPYSLGEAFDALDNDPQSKEILKQIESEIQLMPWNTTTTFCDVMHGRLRLSVAGDSDLNNQFAFAKTRTDARAIKALVEEKNGRLADGSDLRKVKLEHARAFLKLSGEPEESFCRLKRWALIDKMRDKATEMAAAGSKDPLVLKYARPTIDNSNVRQQEFDARAQLVFNRMVAYCRGENQHTESDIAFEQELEDLFDEVAPKDANLGESGNLSESGSCAKSPRVVKSKRKKPGPLSNSKRMRMTTPAIAEDEQEELDSMIAGKGHESMGKVVGRLDKRKQVTFAKPDQEIIRKICTFIGKDNNVTRTVEYIRDPGQVEYYKRKKRNLEQKRSNIETTGEELAITTKKDDFFSVFVQYAESNIEYLRDLFGITKPKQISNKDLKRKASQLGTVTLSASERAWLTQCLFISLVEMESSSEDDIYFDTPSIRCGKHVPKYRSYEWRRDGWRRLDVHLASVLSQLEVPIIAWTCQHRDASGHICGERPQQTENANLEFKKALLTLAKHLDSRLAQGSFLEASTLRHLLYP